MYMYFNLFVILCSLPLFVTFFSFYQLAVQLDYRPSPLHNASVAGYGSVYLAPVQYLLHTIQYMEMQCPGIGRLVGRQCHRTDILRINILYNVNTQFCPQFVYVCTCLRRLPFCILQACIFFLCMDRLMLVLNSDPDIFISESYFVYLCNKLEVPGI